MRAIFFAVLLALSGGGAVGQTATPEIPNPNMNDIAAVFPAPGSPTGAVIYYNPIICQQIGPACTFFKYHEHCHVYLGHLFKPGGQGFQIEAQADACAAANAPPQAVTAAAQLFLQGGSSANWHKYGTPQQRAQRICVWAQQVGNPVGPPC